MRVTLCLLYFPHSVLGHRMNLAQDTWAAATISMHPWSPLGGRRLHIPIVPYPLLLGLCQAANFIASIQILVLSPERITKSQSPLPVMELCQGPSLKSLLVLFFSSDYAGIQIEMRAQ